MEQRLWLWAAVALIAYAVIDYGRIFFRKGLRNLPGPFLARFSGLHRLSMVVHGDAPASYRELHAQYGNIVRVGPNHVSVSDGSEIPKVYGIGSKYLKVTERNLLSPASSDRFA